MHRIHSSSTCQQQGEGRSYCFQPHKHL
uniref:Uncharacterized protein n=1 Tax=Arundo donax TaxID=35708 RepID=A0A0A9I2P9_ARUDO